LGNIIFLHQRGARYCLISIAAIFIIVSMGYSFFSSDRMINNYSPLVDATMEIKYEATTAHLWFEEIMSGDRVVDFEDVIKHVDQAQWYARAMLEGGENPEGNFLPLEDLNLRQEVAETIEHLNKFKEITLKRYKFTEVSGVGSEIDQEYDRLFKNFIVQIDNVESLLQQKIRRDYGKYQQIQITLIIIVIWLIIMGFFLQYRHDREQQNHLIEVTAAKDRVERSESWLKTTMNSMGDGVIITDHNGCVTYLNPVASSLTGWQLHDAKNKKLTAVFNIVNEDTKKPVQDPVAMVIRKNVVIGLANHTELISKDGTRWPISDSAAPIFDHDNNLTGVVLVFHEIMAQKKAEQEKEQLEDQLRQALKMEAIGTLAGGIAHDFNNILAAILGYADMALDDIPDYNPAKHQIKQVLKAGNRAKDLIKHILSFSRKDEVDRSPIAMHLIVKEGLELLRSTIPTTIEIIQNIDSQCGNILADANQIHQVLMNLCTNAAQSMDEDGGALEVELHSVQLSADDLINEPDLYPGHYVHLSIKDSGLGIDQEYIDKIFDPYFTTKEVGKGSGMGLAIVIGIVKSHNGLITVDSKLGEGTTFHVYFPRIEGQTREEIEDDDPLPLPTGNEKILIVDDEESIVDVTKNRMERLGYQVAAKTSSIEALELFRTNPDDFDLVISDQTMPDLTGEQLAKELLATRPNLPIIICTGYSSKIDAQKANFVGVSAFIMKPVDKRELANTIRSVLDREKLAC